MNDEQLKFLLQKLIQTQWFFDLLVHAGQNSRLALFLKHMAVFSIEAMNDPASHSGEWFPRTMEDSEKRTILNRREIEASRKQAGELGLLLEKKQDIPQRLYYAFEWDKLVEIAKDFIDVSRAVEIVEREENVKAVKAAAQEIRTMRIGEVPFNSASMLPTSPVPEDQDEELSEEELGDFFDGIFNQLDEEYDEDDFFAELDQEEPEPVRVLRVPAGTRLSIVENPIQVIVPSDGPSRIPIHEDPVPVPVPVNEDNIIEDPNKPFEMDEVPLPDFLVTEMPEPVADWAMPPGDPAENVLIGKDAIANEIQRPLVEAVRDEVAAQPSLLKVGKTKKARNARAMLNNIPPAYVQTLAAICYGADTPAKMKSIDKAQLAKMGVALQKLHNAGANLQDLRKFETWWKTNWMAIDKPTNTYNFPRPDQVNQMWWQAEKIYNPKKPEAVATAAVAPEGSKDLEAIVAAKEQDQNDGFNAADKATGGI